VAATRFSVGQSVTYNGRKGTVIFATAKIAVVRFPGWATITFQNYRL